MKHKFYLPVLVQVIMISQTSLAQERFDVFPTRTETDIPYRIPAIAALPDGTVICVADYRYSRNDVGIIKDGRIDLHVRVSRDNGCSWGEIAALVKGKSACGHLGLRGLAFQQKRAKLLLCQHHRFAAKP